MSPKSSSNTEYRVKKNFAYRIQAARKHAGLTQKALARRVKISQAAIHKLETGQSRTSRYTIDIAVECNVDPTWLGTGRGTMLPSGKPT